MSYKKCFPSGLSLNPDSSKEFWCYCYQQLCGKLVRFIFWLDYFYYRKSTAETWYSFWRKPPHSTPNLFILGVPQIPSFLLPVSDATFIFIFHYSLRCQVLTEASTKMTIFWDYASCTLVEIYQCFRGAHCLSYEGDCTDDGGSKLLWNISKLLPHYMVQQSRWQPLPHILLWEPDIS
jgi:hypothetical protein